VWSLIEKRYLFLVHLSHVEEDQVDTAKGANKNSYPPNPRRSEQVVQAIAYQTPDRYADNDIEKRHKGTSSTSSGN